MNSFHGCYTSNNRNLILCMAGLNESKPREAEKAIERRLRPVPNLGTALHTSGEKVPVVLGSKNTGKRGADTMHRYIIGTGYAYQKKYGYRTQPGRIPSERAVQVGQSIRLPTTETASPPSAIGW